MKHIIIINGPNLNLLGTRQTDIYGDQTLDEIIGDIKAKFSDHRISAFQSNHEGQLIDWLHEFGFGADGIILNAGAYTHTSIAIADAIRSIECKVVELHISDIYNREDFRQHSYLKEVCAYHVIGKGTQGYELAVSWLLSN